MHQGGAVATFVNPTTERNPKAFQLQHRVDNFLLFSPLRHIGTAPLCKVIRAKDKSGCSCGHIYGVVRKLEDFLGISLEKSGFSRLCRKAMEWLSDDTTHFHYSL